VAAAGSGQLAVRSFYKDVLEAMYQQAMSERADMDEAEAQYR
jgi:hypothetical protein